MKGLGADRTGALAKSLAGRDKGEIFVIIQENREYVFLAEKAGRRESQNVKIKNIYRSSAKAWIIKRN